MKNLLIALVGTMLLFSCDSTPVTYRPLSTPVTYRPLEKGDMFYFGYANEMVDKFTVLDKNDKGVFVKDISVLRFFPYHDLYGSDIFKYIGRYKEPINPLKSLNRLDIFDMQYGTQTVRFIVKNKNDNGLFCTSTQWMWQVSILLPWSDYDSTTYEYIGKYKSLTP